MARRTLYKAASVSVLLALVVGFHVLTRDETPLIKVGTSGDGLPVSSSVAVRGRPVVEPLSAKEVPEGDKSWASMGYRSRTLLASDRECRAVNSISGAREKCDFVKSTDSCSGDNFFNYNYFAYCLLGHAFPAGVVILIFWWIFCFIGLAVCADDFFCPALVVISKTLRLSPNVAGVTFLAFGNGAPDFFSAISSLGGSSGDAGLGVGGLFGAGMFVTTVVVGTISVVRPFKAMERPFLRDIIFYMGAVYWVFFVLYRGRMYLFEAIGLVVVYCTYVVTVIVSGLVYKRQMAAKENKESSGVVLQKATSVKVTMVQQPVVLSGNVNVAFEPEASTDDTSNPALNRIESLGNIGVDDSMANGAPVRLPKNMKQEGTDEKPEKVEEPNINNDIKDVEEDDVPLTWWRMLIFGINPINIDEWPDMRWYSRIYEVFKSPIMFVIQFTCPVVNYEDEVLNNWNRYLQCVQLLCTPMICSFLIRVGLKSIAGGFQVWMLTLIIGAVLATIVFFTSRTDEKPKYHAAFGYMGFLIALIWIYVIATEIVTLLETFGVIFNISNAILGLTLLAWGNSIGDWISNTVMARQGFARMGFAACFGGPLFNLCLGFGIPLLISIIRDGKGFAPLKMTSVMFVLSVFLLISLVSSLVLLPVLRFKVNRIYGLYLLILYVTFLTIALLTETNVILKNFRN